MTDGYPSGLMMFKSGLCALPDQRQSSRRQRPSEERSETIPVMEFPASGWATCYTSKHQKAKRYCYRRLQISGCRLEGSSSLQCQMLSKRRLTRIDCRFRI